MHSCKQINQLNTEPHHNGRQVCAYRPHSAFLTRQVCQRDTRMGRISNAGRDVGCTVWPLLGGWDLIINEQSVTPLLPCRLSPVLNAARQSLLGQSEPREQSGTGPKSRSVEGWGFNHSHSSPSQPTCTFTSTDIWAALELSSNWQVNGERKRSGGTKGSLAGLCSNCALRQASALGTWVSVELVLKNTILEGGRGCLPLLTGFMGYQTTAPAGKFRQVWHIHTPTLA